MTILEDQIRECFGRVVYTHKTHEKQADRCSELLNRLKLAQIGLTSLTASGAIGVLLLDQFWLKVLTALLSLGSLLISGYMKGFDPGAEAQKHRSAAASIWPIRESYLSLLTDLRTGAISEEEARNRRDDLQSKVSQIYKGAPQTGDRAYRRAQDALQNREDLTFSDKEIDHFLPKALRKEPSA